MQLLPHDWQTLFALETPLLELVLRGILLYAAILILLRVMPRRMTGEVAAMDLVLILLIAESASHALGDYDSLADGVVQIGVIGILAWLVDMVSFHVPWVRRLVQSPPLKIIHDGKLLRRNMRREFITEEDLHANLRANDIRDVSEVHCAYVEAEGHLTFVKKKR